MLHGPCGVDNPQAKCIVNGKCSKHFPKEYKERTDWANNSYLFYARPDNGLIFECNRARFTNQYVIPYCPQLLLLFDCHLNIEISAGLGTAKYLSKYIYKGLDRATIEISGGMQDEIKAYLDSQFIGPTEAYCHNLAKMAKSIFIFLFFFFSFIFLSMNMQEESDS